MRECLHRRNVILLLSKIAKVLLCKVSTEQHLFTTEYSRIVYSLSIEQDRRNIQERNEAMTELFRDIQDLNSIVKEMAIQVDGQQDQIGNHSSCTISAFHALIASLVVNH